MLGRVSRLDLLLMLALIGVGVGFYLAYVALDAEAEAFCSGIGDCHTVQNSEYAKVGSIPVAMLGLGMYLALTALLLARRILWRDEPRPLVRWTLLLAASTVVGDLSAEIRRAPLAGAWGHAYHGARPAVMGAHDRGSVPRSG